MMATDEETPRWEVAIHETMAPLEAAWRALEERGCATAFQSFDWLSAWYTVTGRHGAAEPVIVAARRVGSPEIEAILPLCRIRRRFYSEIAFADLAVTDFVGPVFAPEAFRGRDAMAALMAAIVRALPRGDVIRLDKICTTVGDRPNPLAGLPGLVPFPVSLWGMPVSAERAGRQPPGASKRVFNKTRKRAVELAEASVRVFDWSEDPAELSRLFDELVDLRLSRFDALGRPDILREPMWLEFYKTLLKPRSGSLRAVVATLSSDGETVASLFGVGHGRAFHYLVAGFDMERFAHFMPGLQLILELMRECPARGFDYLDLTIGDERYKKDIGAERRPLYELRLPVSVKGRLICLAWRLKVALRAHPRLLATIKRLVGPAAAPAPAPVLRRDPSGA